MGIDEVAPAAMEFLPGGAHGGRGGEGVGEKPGILGGPARKTTRIGTMEVNRKIITIVPPSYRL